MAKNLTSKSFRLTANYDGTRDTRYPLGDKPNPGGGGGGDTPSALKLLSLLSANASNPDYRYWNFNSSYAGSYRHPTTGGSGNLTYRLHYGRIGRGTTSNRIFVHGSIAGGNTGDNGGFCELELPTLVQETSNIALVNRATYAQSTYVQPRVNSPVDAPTDSTGWGSMAQQKDG